MNTISIKRESIFNIFILIGNNTILIKKVCVSLSLVTHEVFIVFD